MSPQRTLTVTALLTILLFSLHWADEIARGIEPNSPGVLFWVWTLIALGACGMISAALAVHALWSLPKARKGTHG